MKIGIDGQKLLIDHLAGPEVYTYETVREFARVDKENEYVVYFDQNPSDDFWKDLSGENEKFSYKIIKSSLSWTQVGLALELIFNPVDVFFNAKHTIPGFHHPKTKMVSMIHGLEFKINKQFYKNPIKELIHPLVLWWVMVFSHKVVIPSQAVMKTVEELNWPLVNLNKFVIVPEGVKKIYHKRSEDQVEEMRDKYKVGSNPYLIFVSTIQPRKNIPRMVHAFSKVVHGVKDQKNLKLLISGKLGWLYQESLEAPGKYEIAENIRFLGRTPDEDLAKLLSGAEAFISCSLEEGFGIPLLEAMACETSAIVSDIPAFKELGQDFVTYVDPNHIDSIEQGILEHLNTDQTTNIKNAKKRADEFTWGKCAERIVEIFIDLQLH